MKILDRVLLQSLTMRGTFSACMDEMLKIRPDLKVLIITAVTKKGVVIEALSKGAKFFLQKPFTEDEIVDAFKKVAGI